MTDDDIVKMAREVGLIPDNSHPMPQTRYMHAKEESLKRFARLVAAAERERCAKVCEELRRPNYSGETGDWIDGTIACAHAIRALGDDK